MSLNKEQILGMEDLAREKLFIPEWKNDVFVRTMSGAERDSFEAKISAESGNKEIQLKNMRARLAVLTLCDENGKQLFETKDAPELGMKSAAALDRIFDVAQRLSKIGDDDVEKLVKN